MHQANGGAAEPSVGGINSHRHGQRSQRGSRNQGDAALWARGISWVLVTAEAGDGAAFVGTAQRIAGPATATAVEVLDTHRYAEVNGARIHYVVGSNGPAVALLHGWPYTWAAWRKLPRHLATSVALTLGSLIAAMAMVSVARSILRGRPPMRPRARAAARLAWVRSAINSRSNSAKVAKIQRRAGRCQWWCRDLRAGAVLGEADVLPTARVATAFLHGFVAMELAGAFRLGGDPETAFARGLDAVLPHRRRPPL